MNIKYATINNNIFLKGVLMQNSFFDNKTYGYALTSNQILGMLYKMEDNRDKFYNTDLINKAKNLIEIIKNGALIQKTGDINLISNNNFLSSNGGFFIYNYGLKVISQVATDRDAQEYLGGLLEILGNIKSASIDDLSAVETFFESISELLNEDLECAKYIAKDRSPSIGMLHRSI
ncbi:hypothetical protein BN3087_280011 [Sulfurovum sp. enrichment culture clone C5]|uniref:Uncharacterized protein n=1 Tax=Sulfurovum sp. enrichment culture clone C5 TaxID=497650 RepID=A0A0S4XMX5_9BACT|nr:hypothetical protein BN3087_280011 [Sulfurovum sp. enrichment culture clone C5]